MHIKHNFEDDSYVVMHRGEKIADLEWFADKIRVEFNRRVKRSAPAGVMGRTKILSDRTLRFFDLESLVTACSMTDEEYSITNEKFENIHINYQGPGRWNLYNDADKKIGRLDNWIEDGITAVSYYPYRDGDNVTRDGSPEDCWNFGNFKDAFSSICLMAYMWHNYEF